MYIYSVYTYTIYVIYSLFMYLYIYIHMRPHIYIYISYVIVYILYEPSKMITKNHFGQIVKGPWQNVSCMIWLSTIVACDYWLIHLATCLRAHPPPQYLFWSQVPSRDSWLSLLEVFVVYPRVIEWYCFVPACRRQDVFSCRISCSVRVVKCVEKNQTFNLQVA